MAIKFKSKIIRGNNRNVGFIKLPFNKRTAFKIGEQRLVRLMLGAKRNLEFFAKVRDYGGFGFYVPKKIVEDNDLLYRNLDMIAEKIDGFCTIVGKDGRIYLPAEVAKTYQIKNKDIMLLRGKIGKGYEEKFSLVTIRKRKNTNEYRCNFDCKFSGKSGIFNIENISQLSINKTYSSLMKGILINFIFSQIDGRRTIVFYGNRIPVIIDHNIDIKNFAYYLGAYFADGTKRGNNWGICASTFEQARYYLQMHKRLICKPNLKISLSYTSYKGSVKVLKQRLYNQWWKNANVSLEANKIRIIPTKTKFSLNRNIFGSLVIKELKQLTMVYYNKLLDCLITKIVDNKDKSLAFQFICGVLEGDGSPSARSRGGIVITTNVKELEILKKIFQILKLKNEGHIEKTGKAYIRIGSLEILKNLLLLYQKIFKYYPKRRNKLIKRLLGTGAAKFIMEKQKSTSGWIKRYMEKEKILDKEYNLTKKGRLIKRHLLKMEKEI